MTQTRTKSRETSFHFLVLNRIIVLEFRDLDIDDEPLTYRKTEICGHPNPKGKAAGRGALKFVVQNTLRPIYTMISVSNLAVRLKAGLCQRVHP